MDIRYDVHQLTIRSKVATLVGVTAIAVALSGCGGGKSATTTTASAAPTTVASIAPGMINSEIVHAGSEAKAVADVRASDLTPLDKNRFEAFITDHPKIPGAYDTKTVREVINLQISYEVGLGLAEQSRQDDIKHTNEIAKLITSKLTIIRELPHRIDLHFDIQNLTAKPIKNLEFGLRFVSAKDGTEIGLAEVHITRNLAGHGKLSFDYPMSWVRFGSDTGTMMAAIGVPKKAFGQVTEIKYADGTDAGFDD